MNHTDASTPDELIAALPADRRAAIGAVREVIRANLPPERFPDTYNGQPLGRAALAVQKNHMAFYLNKVYGDPETDRWFRERFAASGTKLDMGKSCLRFKRIEDLRSFGDKPSRRTAAADWLPPR